VIAHQQAAADASRAIPCACLEEAAARRAGKYRTWGTAETKRSLASSLTSALYLARFAPMETIRTPVASMHWANSSEGKKRVLISGVMRVTRRSAGD
jgi:hypothetical protein